MRLALICAALALAACASPQGPDPAVADGRAIAEAQCAACHAVGEFGESPNPAAPIFRTVLARYRADVLTEELVNGVQVAHPMPDFQFNPQGADALVAYLRSIQETRGE